MGSGAIEEYVRILGERRELLLELLVGDRSFEHEPPALLLVVGANEDACPRVDRLPGSIGRDPEVVFHEGVVCGAARGRQAPGAAPFACDDRGADYVFQSTSMKRSGKRILILLVAAVVAMTAGLVGLIAIVHQTSDKLAAIDTLVVGDTAPSIVVLQAATVDLGELDVLVREKLLGQGVRALVDDEIAARHAAFARNVHTYLGLPIDPGETQVRIRLQQASEALDRVLARVAETQGPAPPDLVSAFDGAVNRLDTTLLDGVTLNTEIEERAVASLRSVRRMALPAAIVLQVVCVTAAAAVLALAFRVLHDTAEAATASRRLLEEKTNELEAFSSRIAHDLMSPLMSVGIALAAAEPCLDAPERERVHRMVVRAGSSLQHVRMMTSDLLEFARAGATPPPNVEADAATVARAVADDLTPFAEEARVELRIEIGTRRRVRCSAGALTSVLTNLVQNAVKHLDAAPTRRVTLRARNDGDIIRFEVQDTGPGIDPADHERIFEPYVQGRNRAGGLGLGLATVKRIVEAHGGRVGVESERGKGACFWVTVPAIAAAPARAEGGRPVS